MNLIIESVTPSSVFQQIDYPVFISIYVIDWSLPITLVPQNRSDLTTMPPLPPQLKMVAGAPAAFPESWYQ